MNSIERTFYQSVKKTPLEKAKYLSTRLGTNVWLKREDMQPVFSFKLRGALYRMLQLSESDKKSGVIAASAGNHAQGVAYSAKKLGISATIVMPLTTPDIKVQAVTSYGADIMLFGDSFDDAQQKALELAKTSGQIFIHPFDDPEVIKGQGTIARELLDQSKLPINYIFIPIGGGGLISGIGQVINASSPNTKIIGVEPANSNAMEQSLRAGKVTRLDRVGIFADGVAVKEVGKNTFRACQQFVDEIITVSTDEICAAIRDVHKETRTIVEPAGALSTAGITKYFEGKANLANLNVIGINSGANMTFEKLQFVAERTMTGSHKEAIYCVTLPEQPGALRDFCERVVNSHTISEFNYRKNHADQANIFVGVGINGADDRLNLEAQLKKHSYEFYELTENELAKSHIRHMVGGALSSKTHEKLYNFNFPERPGALQDFLNKMSTEWNISLFHYRWIGGDVGKVLMGFELNDGNNKDFAKFLDEVGYDYIEETANPAYKSFLID